MPVNHLADLTTIIEDLDSAGRISHVTSEVELDLHLAGIAARLEGKPNAVMFHNVCLLYTSPSPRDRQKSRMPSSA